MDAIDFVIVNSHLHDEYGQFKKAEIQSSHSLLLVVELLVYYCLTECPHVLDSQSLVLKFGKVYIGMDMSEVDALVSWMHKMNDRYYGVEGEGVFDKETLSKVLKGTSMTNLNFTTDNFINFVFLGLQESGQSNIEGDNSDIRPSNKEGAKNQPMESSSGNGSEERQQGKKSDQATQDSEMPEVGEF